jgi:5-methylcytosine-specific restriction endonuclease McrA
MLTAEEKKAYRRAYNAEHAAEIKAQQAIYRSANKERRRIQGAEYDAARREKVKAYRAENKATISARSKNYYAANKNKIKAQRKAKRKALAETQRKHYLANADRILARVAAYSKAHPEVVRSAWLNRRARERQANGKISSGLSKRLLKLQHGKCPCCRDDLNGVFHLDHIMPLALGGGNDDSNIQLLCPACNLRKSAKHPVDFMQSLGFLL